MGELFSSTPKQRFTIPGPAGDLELEVTQAFDTSANIIAVICHPDPKQEGTMDNKVVTTMARTFNRMGVTCIRFNFRGVGKSEGAHSDTSGECDDLTAVLEWVVSCSNTDYHLWLAGFSFGSYIAASIANRLSGDLSQLISIAPPVHHYDFASLHDIVCPWLVVQGDDDDVVPPEVVHQWAAAHTPKPTLLTMADTGHFFHGKLVPFAELLQQHLSVV